jgi:hypothetical protein
MSMGTVRRRICTRTSRVALSHHVTSTLGNNGRFETSDATASSNRRWCEERCIRGKSSSKTPHRFYALKVNPTSGTYLTMSTAMRDESITRPSIHPTIESMRSVRKAYDSSVSVGFVPTMGALHEGKRKKNENRSRECATSRFFSLISHDARWRIDSSLNFF